MQRVVITRREALAAGLSEDAIAWRLKSGKWQLLFPNVYLTQAGRPTWEQQIQGACKWAGPNAVASHGAGGRLFKFPGFEKAALEVTVSGRDVRSTRDVVIHRVRDLPKKRIAKIGPIPVTTPTWTIVNLAAVEGFLRLQAAVDYAICHELTTWERLEIVVNDAAGQDGIKQLRRILKEREAAESLLQRRVRQLLVDAGFPAPVLEYPEGRFRIDLAYPEHRLAIETDGYGSHSDRQVFGEDRIKQNHLIFVGWRVLRFTWDDLIMRPHYIVSTVAAFLGRPIPAPLEF